MTILEALKQLRDDIKLWVTNNLNCKLNKNLGTEETGKALFVDENGDIVPAVIEEKFFKTYADLGLDETTATIPAIVEAMPKKSIAVLYTGNESNLELTPNNEKMLGTIIIHKIDISRTSLTYESVPSIGKRYHGCYYRIGVEDVSSGVWTGWIEIAHQEDLLNVTQRVGEAELDITNLNTGLASVLTNYVLTEKTDCFDFSDLSTNRGFSVSYYSNTSNNKPSTGYGFLLTYRVNANTYLLLAIDSTGLYHGAYSNGTGTWNAK